MIEKEKLTKKEIENIIQEDISYCKRQSDKTKRKNTLIKYYNNPIYCKNCGKIIRTSPKERMCNIKSKLFCSSHCSAIYNNHFHINKTKSKVKLCDNELFIEYYSKSSSISDLAKFLGYKNRINKKIKEQIIFRLKELNLSNFKPLKKKEIDTLTKGYFFKSQKNWQSARSTITRKAREEYKKSNKPKKCVVCGYDKTYDVAHIKAVSSFSDDTLLEEINNINNLIALCPNHHWEYDNDLLDINSYL